jgi:hypothetical protein
MKKVFVHMVCKWSLEDDEDPAEFLEDVQDGGVIFDIPAYYELKDENGVVLATTKEADEDQKA